MAEEDDKTPKKVKQVVRKHSLVKSTIQLFESLERQNESKQVQQQQQQPGSSTVDVDNSKVILEYLNDKISTLETQLKVDQEALANLQLVNEQLTSQVETQQELIQKLQDENLAQNELMQQVLDVNQVLKRNIDQQQQVQQQQPCSSRTAISAMTQQSQNPLTIEELTIQNFQQLPFGYFDSDDDDDDD